jgi:RNA polymerase sigma-70 factor (ECF subfamily)
MSSRNPVPPHSPSDPNRAERSGDRAKEEERAAADERDRKLVGQVLAGNKEAFRALVEAHQSRVFHLARSLVRNPSDASDIAQETFVRAFVNLKSYRSEGSFTAWVARIANNLAIDFLRRQKTQGVTELNETLAETEQLQTGLLAGRVRADPQSATLRKELGQQLEKALAQLPEKHRAILILREIDGLSYEELAVTLEIPVGTVMSRLFHARGKMQAILRGYVDSSPAADQASASIVKKGE